MADFQSSLLAQEIEDVLVGAVTTTARSFSETQKAIARNNIGAATYGTALQILAHYDTLAELVATATNPTAGDCYSVGTSTPYTLYIYDPASESFVSYGNVQPTAYASRMVEDVLVSSADWEYSTDNYADYPYSAKITVTDITANDFPIVVFAPSEATSMNYCSTAISMDGYVVIFARTAPTANITIQSIIYIVEGD